MAEVNTRYIQVRGRIEAPGEIKLGDDLNVSVIVTSIEEKDNDNGTVDVIYKAKLFTA